MFAIEARGLHYRYPKARGLALSGLDLAIESGAFHAVLGPNGAGKTTFIRMACGLLKPQDGIIKWWGEAHISRTNIAKSIGYAPQEIALYPSLSARENAQFFAKCQSEAKITPKSIEARLDQVGLLSVADQRLDTYSGGMKRRANLAMALLHQPKLLILDEPMTGVDPQSRLNICRCLEEERSKGTTLLYTSHLMPEVEQLCESITIVDQGRSICSGSREALLKGEGRVNTFVFDQEIEHAHGLKQALIALNIVEGSPLLNQAGFAMEGRSLKIKGVLPISLAALIQAMAECGQTPLSFSSAQTTLEDLFLSQTGRQLRDVSL